MVKVSEYIDKEAFISEKRKQFCENCSRRKGIKHGKECFIYEIGCSLCRACDIGDMIDAVEDFPAADVVPVVRCKDCIHKVTTGGGEYNPQDIVCDYWSTDGLEDNGFCYIGVKGKYDENENCYSLLDEKNDPAIHGRWIYQGHSIIVNLESAIEQFKAIGKLHRVEIIVKCSNCFINTSIDDTISYKYCPHCGAKMDESDEEEQDDPEYDRDGRPVVEI